MNKINFKWFYCLIIIFIVYACQDEKYEPIDSMIVGISNNTGTAIPNIIENNEWAVALVELREHCVKLTDVKAFYNQDGYKGEYDGDKYGIDEKEASLKYLQTQIDELTYKVDSIWEKNIGDTYASLNPESPGIAKLKITLYNETTTTLESIYQWIHGAGEENDFASISLERQIPVLAELVEFNIKTLAEVDAYIEGITTMFNDGYDDYLFLADEIVKPEFTKVQKDGYELLSNDVDAIQALLDEDEIIASDPLIQDFVKKVSSLVNYVNNGYISDAKQPVNPGEIASIGELLWLSTNSSQWGTDWKLVNDIDASETRRWNGGNGFNPIGTFTATFDGDFHIISGLYINGLKNPKTAFIASLSGGTVKNLGFVYVNITTGNNVNHSSAIVGLVTGGTVENCFVDGDVRMNSGQSGIMSGRMNSGNIINCISYANGIANPPNNHDGAVCGLVTGTINLNNVLIAGSIAPAPGKESKNVKAIIAANVGAAITSSGVYFDNTVTAVEGGSGGGVGLPTDQWGDLANLPELSPDLWEIATITAIDENPRPYLKGFNYEVIADMIVPE